MINVEKQPEVPYERLGLESIHCLLERVGNPHHGLRVIHIAGSKGKGSTALLVEAICRAAGERVGTFTSPHLESWTERFRIDGREVEGEHLAASVAQLRPHVDALRAAAPSSAPTFFDVTTAAALLLFQRAKVERVVLEVGLGGRLDSTNVVVPAVACVTSIELEHTEKLGSSLGEIAHEKAGVLKPGVPTVAGDLPAPARAVLESRAREVGSELAWLGRDFAVEILEAGPLGLSLTLRDGPVAATAKVPVLGAHQAGNAALALACARRARVASDADLPDAVVRGFATVQLPGRIDVLGRSPWLIADAAHTAVSARALAAVLTSLPHRRSHLVISISAGKDARSILESLLPEADRVTLTRAEPTRSLAPAEIAAAVRMIAPGLEVCVIPNPHLALRAAREALAKDDLLCATGSVYLAGIARQVLREPDAAERVAVSRGDGWTVRGEP